MLGADSEIVSIKAERANYNLLTKAKNSKRNQAQPKYLVIYQLVTWFITRTMTTFPVD
jgi:hypothetical protein